MPNVLKVTVLNGIECLVVKKIWKVIFLILLFSHDCKFYSTVQSELRRAKFFHQFSFFQTEKNMTQFSEVYTVHKVSKQVTCDNKCIISRLFVFHCCHKVLF